MKKTEWDELRETHTHTQHTTEGHYWEKRTGMLQGSDSPALGL